MPFGELRGRPLVAIGAVVFLLICTAFGGIYGKTKAKPEYESDAVIMVLPPGAGNKDARMNPFINLDNNMVQLALALTTALNSGQTAVDLAPVDPSISQVEASTVKATDATASAGETVQVQIGTKASDGSAAQAMTKRMIDYSRNVLRKMQVQAGVSGPTFADIVVVVPATSPQAATSSAFRSMISSAVLGLIAGAAIIAAAMGIANRRRKAAASKESTGTTDTAIISRNRDEGSSDDDTLDDPYGGPRDDERTFEPDYEPAEIRRTAGEAFRREQAQNYPYEQTANERPDDYTPAVRRAVVKRTDSRPTPPPREDYHTTWYPSERPPSPPTYRTLATATPFTDEEIAAADVDYDVTPVNSQFTDTDFDYSEFADSDHHQPDHDESDTHADDENDAHHEMHADDGNLHDEELRSEDTELDDDLTDEDVESDRDAETDEHTDEVDDEDQPADHADAEYDEPDDGVAPDPRADPSEADTTKLPLAAMAKRNGAPQNGARMNGAAQQTEPQRARAQIDDDEPTADEQDPQAGNASDSKSPKQNQRDRRRQPQSSVFTTATVGRR